jgi:hypothetical protein
MSTTVVNMHHKVPYDVYIGRGSIWGNPFTHLKGTTALYHVASRDDAITSYKAWIMNQSHLLARLHELKGKVLACYCCPQACHGHVLAEMADALPDDGVYQKPEEVLEEMHKVTVEFMHNADDSLNVVKVACEKCAFEYELNANRYFKIWGAPDKRWEVDAAWVKLSAHVHQLYRNDNKLFRVIIAGGREFRTEEHFSIMVTTMDNILAKKIEAGMKIVITSGMAPGADTLGIRYAQLRGFDVNEMPADWKKYGKAAGYRRNEDMAKVNDAAVCYWDSKSKGTGHMINISKEHKLAIRVIPYA